MGVGPAPQRHPRGRVPDRYG
uniref:Uncharacterized protein n=1 Tax=Arundo donax TaxID=35708 RepID=A0A0A9GS06_ARUDO